MSGPEHDEEFEAFLKRRSPLHRRLSDFDHAEPSVDLDRIVLGRARDAIEAPRNPPLFRETRWAMPVGLAATILLAFAIVINVNRHELQPARTAARAPALAAAQAESAAATHDATTSEQSVAANASAGSGTSVAVGDDIRIREADATLERAETRRAKKAEAPPVLASTDRAFASASRAAAPVAAPPLADASATHADPESWLREITRLRTEGKVADADRELEAFRRAYPNHSGSALAKPPTR